MGKALTKPRQDKIGKLPHRTLDLQSKPLSRSRNKKMRRKVMKQLKKIFKIRKLAQSPVNIVRKSSMKYS